MKYVILLALITMAVAQFRPGHDHSDPLQNMIHEEVQNIMNNNQGISVDDCAAKCDALFDLAAGHDEDITDRLCRDEFSIKSTMVDTGLTLETEHVIHA
ncbi:uncharacterized protein LOC143302029 [Babylonia areolata]|uniref:uncharacterized protein LOC143302029 n=1 Tax=Babylonia areolata TaxID=304850 RepID=UPI003FD05432